MKTKYNFLNIIFTFIVIVLIFFIGFNGERNYNEPIQLFQVYLHGEVIGTIDSKDKLLKIIDDEQAEIKNKYNVETVYLPKNLEIKSIITYSGKIDDIKSVYEKIKETENFTIKGFALTIKEESKPQKEIYFLNKDDLDKAVKNVTLSFVGEENYNKYMLDKQKEIVDVGEYIENISLNQDVTIKPTYISSVETIFTNDIDLTRYLLFGTLNNQKEYKIKSGDTIEKVALKHKLSSSEFLIANPCIKSEDVLLYPGQKVNIALINPVLDIAVVSEKVELQTVSYSTKYEYDYSVPAGSSFVKKEGSKGKSKVTFKIKTVNGYDASVVKTNTVVINSAVTKIIVRGAGTTGEYVATDGNWGWPTVSGYRITSYLGYRWGSFHAGIDIAGTGYGSPIYSAGSGVVIKTGSGSSTGNYVRIDHKNNYVSNYYHLRSINVRPGDIVNMGTKIGAMGNTGFVIPAPSRSHPTAGTHLHFEVWYNGNVINPLNLY